MTATPKRFIAGAICPRCAAMDRIRSWENEGVLYRECVSCDFFEQLPVEDTSSPEIETRVNQPRETPADDTIQTVRIITPPDR
ncbi:YheV family putative zinc ribbon protein [Larsenimonas rhizosphaerae]|uniref:YheV family putative zinc ribbon protein n=1 Tax=Larsenimonas rhizosphaerae TaxID=2944682 RepID=UPI0020335BF0|nr:YheV family putative zinc ribbon protein [Larsenimonas rhizosphaerae]MCM2129248.1 YheV family putative metal-binding protein [Larsenimonas rhizosphaerae]